MSWFVRPEQTVLKLSEGQTLTVKRRLNAGERDAYYARMYVESKNGQYIFDSVQVRRSLVLAYLLDWSLTDEAGKLVPIRDVSIDDLTAKLQLLDPERFEEIHTAINAHEQAMTAERAQEKNGQDGANGLPVISPSPSAAAGASSGSVN